MDAPKLLKHEHAASRAELAKSRSASVGDDIAADITVATPASFPWRQACGHEISNEIEGAWMMPTC